MRYCVVIVLLGAHLALTTAPTQAAGDTRGIRAVVKDGAAGGEREVSLYRMTYAVVIGIDHYPELAFDQQLSYAVKDAKGVEQCLRDNFAFDRIVALYNEDATREGILNILLTEMGATSEEDGLFVFFAGHGMTVKTSRYGDLGYIVPHDGFLDTKRLDRNISMTLIKEDISKKIPAKHIFYVIDACYSGLLLAGRSGERRTGRNYEYLMEVAKEPVRQVLSAGGKGQIVLDGGPRGHSVFTGRLIEALEGAEDFITASEIAAIVKEKVYSDARSRGHRQTPKDGELFGLGDFVFVTALEKKAATLSDQVREAQEELLRLEELERRASAAMDKQERSHLELERRQTEAKLKADQMRMQRLEDERKRQAAAEAERVREEKELRKKKESETRRLEELRREVEKKRKALGKISDTGFTVKETMNEMKRIMAQKRKIEYEFHSEKNKSLGEVRSFYSEKLGALHNMEKDMFETQDEFQKKKMAETAKVESERDEKIASIEDRYEKEISDQLAPFHLRLRELESREFTATSDQVKVDLQEYNADMQYFPIVLKFTLGDNIFIEEGRFYLKPNVAKELWLNREFLRGEIRYCISNGIYPRIKYKAVVDDATGSLYDLNRLIWRPRLIRKE